MYKHIYISLAILFSHNFLFSQINDRSVAVNDYNNNYINSDFTSAELAWTGNVASCNAGTFSNIVRDKMLQRINYYRRMVGVEDQITFDPVKSAKCQEAALMMHANNALNHYPPNDWLCFTQDGYEAAASNLSGASLDYFNPIDEYMLERGDGNFFVGHRRWLLYSKSKVMGVGQTYNPDAFQTSGNALWVFQDTDHPAIYNNFIAYPPAGYIPNSLVFEKWSFSLPGADFSNASVIIQEGNNNIPLSIISTNNNGFGDNTIVWKPSSINTTSATDIFYTVYVNNVSVNGSTQNFSYTTKIFNPSIGDVNADGQVNVIDALVIMQYEIDIRTVGDCNNLNQATEICLGRGDLNMDNMVNLADALMIMQCEVQIPNSFCPN